MFPDQAPPALQAVASLEVQVSIDESPESIVVGSATIETVGNGDEGGVTVTVTDCVVGLPLPWHFNVNVLVDVKGPTFSLPTTSLFPNHAPLARHFVALVEDHVKVEKPSVLMVLGPAVRNTVEPEGAAIETKLTSNPDNKAIRLNRARVHSLHTLRKTFPSIHFH